MLTIPDNRAAHTDVDDKHISTSKNYGQGTSGTTTTAGTHDLGDKSHSSALGSTTHGTNKPVTGAEATLSLIHI